MQKLNIRNLRCGVLAFTCMLIYISFAFVNPEASVPIATETTAKSAVDEKEALYDNLELGALGLSHEAFTYALAGFTQLLEEGKIQKNNILTILDFSLPSGKKRLFVIDMETGELVFHTYAAHGKKSGTDVATEFSNKMNSNKSSLGFYVTGGTYTGKHGTSLRLLGEEKGINDNALARGIVMHSASYVDESIIAHQGFIGRSQGCPALPGNIYKDVIEKIKNGSCLFIYSPDKYYTSHSKILKDRVQV